MGKRWTKWALCAFYGLITPVGIGVGIGVRQLYAPASQCVQIVSGVLVTISMAILLYTGLMTLNISGEFSLRYRNRLAGAQLEDRTAR